jgi:Cu-processing system permease protein
VLVIARKEFGDGLRNRWVIAATVLMATLALALTLLGSAPTGVVAADRLAVTVVSLSSLSIYLVPLIALLLSFDAVVGEVQQGTMLLLLAHPLARWQVIAGKFLGHAAILLVATLVGYGIAGVAVSQFSAGEIDAATWSAFAIMLGSSILLGCDFLAIGYLVSVRVRERTTAAGLALAVWVILVAIYDMALFAVLVEDQGRTIGGRGVELLLTINPADAYRLLNQAGSEAVRRFSGLGDVAANVDLRLLLVALVAWAALPLAATAALFQRKEL